MNRILIGALSAAAYDDRRQWCLDTWMPAATALGMDAVFLIGDQSRQTPVRRNRRLLLPVPDDYPHLPMKTRAFCEWSLGQTGWDYLFKCDDDTAIVASRLAEYDTAGHDYIGAEWRPGVKYGSGGAGYLLSRQAVEVVAEHLTESMGPEDLLVGNLLRWAGIGLHEEPRFIPWGSADHRPTPQNDLITAHAVDGRMFRAIHREIDEPMLGARELDT